MRIFIISARDPQISIRNLRKLDCFRKTGTHFCCSRALPRKRTRVAVQKFTLMLRNPKFA